MQTLASVPDLDAVMLREHLLGKGIHTVLHNGSNGRGARLSFIITALHTSIDVKRKEDIPLLAQHFLHKYNLAVGKKIQAFTSETLAAMMQYDWPGNVRELENAVEHAVLVEKSTVISPTSLPMNLTRKENSETAAELGLRDMLNLLERQIILDTLIRANWIKKRAAGMLRIDARNLPYLLRKHKLSEGLGPN